MSRRWLLMVFVPVFAVIGAAAYLTVVFAGGERAEQEWVIHTYLVLGSLGSLDTDLAKAESDERAYVLTGAAGYRAAFGVARANIWNDLAHFRYLTRDNPHQQQRAGALRDLVEQRLADIKAAFAPGKVGAARANSATLPERRGMADALETVINVALDEERKLLRGRIDARRAVESREIASSIAAALLTLVILAIAVAWLIRDNSKLLKSEALRRRQARMLQTTFDNIRDGILVFDENDRVVASNEAFHRLMDYPESLTVPGTDLKEIRDCDVVAGRQQFDQIDLLSRYERFVRQGRELDVYRAPIPDEGFLVVASDVTARVRADAAARQAQKMDAIGQLTGGIAHDFNNLLQVIRANLDLAMASGRNDSKTEERLRNANSAVERGSRLTSQLLAFARRQVLEPRSINPGRLIQEAAELLRRTLGERVEIECVIAGGLWNVLVDAGQVENAIINLAINSRDAMPAGGKLTIEASNAFLDDEYAARHAEVTAGQYVMLAVSDTGCGMAPEIVSRVFDPFFTTKPEGKGTGLGLSQVYGFVKQSGGHIKVYSEPAHGTTIKIYLPRTRKPPEALEPTVATAAIPGGNETILVVEDDLGVRVAVVDTLTDLGYAVFKAENADQALAILNSGAKVDLLFTDVVMPGAMNTREFTKLAAKLCPAMKILYTSGYTQNAIVHNGRLDEDASLLGKPYRKDELARKIRDLLEASTVAKSAELPKAKPVAKVLIVEDMLLIRMTTVDMIRDFGLAVAEASNGVEALEILRTDDMIDVLLTDLGLPGMSGGELIEEALKLRPGLKVIIASGRYSARSEGVTAPNVTELPKPYTPADLRAALGA